MSTYPNVQNQFLFASNASATTDIFVGRSYSTYGSTSPTGSLAFHGGGPAAARVQLIVGTAAFLSLIVKNTASSVLASGMLLPKTGSAALTANVMYTFNHQIDPSRLYNYQLSAATTTVTMQVDVVRGDGHFE